MYLLCSNPRRRNNFHRSFINFEKKNTQRKNFVSCSFFMNERRHVNSKITQPEKLDWPQNLERVKSLN